MSTEKIELSLPIMQKKRPSKLLWLVPVALVLALACGGFYWWQSQISDSAAQVESGVLTLTAGVSGRIGEVPVQLGDTIEAGQVIARLDDAALRAQLDEARARMAAVVPGAAATATARAGEQSLLANMERARQLEQQSTREMQHFATLHAQALLEVRRLDLQGAGEASKSAARLRETEARMALEDARAALTAQSRARAAADADLQRYRADITMLSRAGLTEQTLAQVQEILGARLHEAEAQFASATIVAPGEGRLARLTVKPGGFVQAGQTVAELEPLRLRVLARVEPAQAMRLQVGTAARVQFADLPGQAPLAATVTHILPPDENGRVPVRVMLDAAFPADAPARNSLTQVKFITFLF